MGPRRGRRGRGRLGQARRRQGMGASMGPRRGRRGRGSGPKAGRTTRRTLQWGHDEVVVEESGETVVFAILDALQWGHDEVVVEEGPHPDHVPVAQQGFNGATTRSSWKSSCWVS